MIFQGQAITVQAQDSGIATLNFDSVNEPINVLSESVINELKSALTALEDTPNIKGLIISSAKESFIVGADITEFLTLFQQDEETLATEVQKVHTVFNTIADLPYPTVTAINGLALGGGLEVALTTDYRVMAEGAEMGFPEIKLGIIPGYGGTVRTPRLVGIDNAVEWIATGKQYKAAAALKTGMIDAVVKRDKLEAAALHILQQTIDGDLATDTYREQMNGALLINDMEMIMAFETCKAMVAQQAGKHYKAPMIAIKAMEQHAKLNRDEALIAESQSIARIAKTETAGNMISLFLNDQLLTKKAKGFADQSDAVKQAAVLGAGIMGGGIAYQSAYKGTPIRMKDIMQEGIDAGLKEATGLLSKQLKRGRINAEKMGATLNKITPTLSYENFDSVDLVVEAVVENPRIKAAVLAEVEQQVSDDAIITSNTSTIPITTLAESLQRPENFCGMHFFNPVHRMPLVEIIRGEKTSEAAIAKTVNYALAMGKKPVVVNDCPGFLVNRILFAYLNAFVELLRDGADYLAVDKAATNFGWPMGPAHLCDVVGIDTAVHAGNVMAEGFPARMNKDYTTALEVLLENNRLGEKNAIGFYKYEADKKGKTQKVIDESLIDLLKPHVSPAKALSEEEIIDRLMIPFCLEAYLCLEEKIASSASDIDMSLIFGLGFPPFRGGVMRYMHNLGLKNFCDNTKQYESLGPMYTPSASLIEMANNGKSFY